MNAPAAHGPDPGVAQFAVSVSDLPRAARLYCDALGCRRAGGLLIWGDFQLAFIVLGLLAAAGSLFFVFAPRPRRPLARP